MQKFEIKDLQLQLREAKREDLSEAVKKVNDVYNSKFKDLRIQCKQTGHHFTKRYYDFSSWDERRWTHHMMRCKYCDQQIFISEEELKNMIDNMKDGDKYEHGNTTN